MRTTFIGHTRDSAYRRRTFPRSSRITHRYLHGPGTDQILAEEKPAPVLPSGFATVWLACAIGNDRAARFYEKCGWVRARTQVNRLETPDGVFEFEVWRYEKAMKT